MIRTGYYQSTKHSRLTTGRENHPSENNCNTFQNPKVYGKQTSWLAAGLWLVAIYHCSRRHTKKIFTEHRLVTTEVWCCLEDPNCWTAHQIFCDRDGCQQDTGGFCCRDASVYGHVVQNTISSIVNSTSIWLIGAVLRACLSVTNIHGCLSCLFYQLREGRRFRQALNESTLFVF